jgi:hypothetical protein
MRRFLRHGINAEKVKTETLKAEVRHGESVRWRIGGQPFEPKAEFGKRKR